MWGRLSLFGVSFLILSFSNPSVASKDTFSFINDIIQNPNQTCRSYDCIYLKRDISRDTKNCNPKAEVAFAKPNLFGSKKIRGFILYEGVWPENYSYTLTANQTQGYVLTVKIYIKNHNEFSSESLNDLREKLALAADIWQQYSPEQIYKFNFLIVDDPRNADYWISLVHGETRGPYFFKWSADWGPISYAHEIGHMMGLDDEYGTVFYRGNCSNSSIMCNESLPRDYHYYQIYKRAYCN